MRKHKSRKSQDERRASSDLPIVHALIDANRSFDIEPELKDVTDEYLEEEKREDT